MASLRKVDGYSTILGGVYNAGNYKRLVKVSGLQGIPWNVTRRRMGGYLEQVGVGASAVENHLLRGFVDTVDKKPIWFNVAFPPAFIIPMQGMIFVFWQEGLLVDKQIDYLA